jgi:hypothetical protein
MTSVNWRDYEELEEDAFRKSNKPKTKQKKPWKQVSETHIRKKNVKQWKNKRRKSRAPHNKNT